MKTFKLISVIGVAAADFARILQSGDTMMDEEASATTVSIEVTRDDELIETIPFEESSGVSMAVKIEAWNMIYTTGDTPTSVIQLLVFYDFLTGFLEEDNYY